MSADVHCGIGPAAFRARVWLIMSEGQGLGARRSPPEGASVGYP